MARHILAAVVCGCLLLFYGCETIQEVNPFVEHLAHRSEIEKLLPTDVKMNSIVCYGKDWKEHKTVEQQLVQLYAHIGKDGKICDVRGDEIHFATVSSSGSPRDYKLTQKDLEELDKLIGRHGIVIVVLIEPHLATL